MAVLDNLLVLMDAQSCLTVATHAGTTIDFGSLVDAWGDALTPDYSLTDDLWMNIVVQTAATATGAPAMTPSISSCSSATGTLTKHQTGPAWAKAALTAGAEIMRVPLPKGMNRYVNVQIVVATSPFTTFAVDAYITKGVDSVS